MNKTIYRTVWRHQEVEFKDMDWGAFISDTFNYLCRINNQDFNSGGREFRLKSEAEKYIKENPIRIERRTNCFFIQWLELYKVASNEDGCTVNLDFLDTSKLFTVVKLNLMDIPAESVSSFDLSSIPIETVKDLLQS